MPQGTLLHNGRLHGRKNDSKNAHWIRGNNSLINVPVTTLHTMLHTFNSGIVICQSLPFCGSCRSQTFDNLCASVHASTFCHYSSATTVPLQRVHNGFCWNATSVVEMAWCISRFDIGKFYDYYRTSVNNDQILSILMAVISRKIHESPVNALLYSSHPSFTS